MRLGRLCCAVLLGTVPVFLTACAKVDATHDFVETAERIKTRLDIREVYDPSADAAVEGKVELLLADGLTVDEAVSVALLNNAGFQAMFHAIGASRADVVQSGLLTNPSLTIGARFPDAGGRSELTFGFAQQLVDLWQIPVRKNIAEAELDQVVLGVLDEAVRIAAMTRSQYYEVLWCERVTELTKENLSLTSKLLDVARARYEAGDTSALDVGLVRTNVFIAQQDESRAERDCANARLALAQTMGLARSGAAWRLADSPDPPQFDLDSREEIERIAVMRRFDLQIADARVRAAEQEVELQLLKVYPSIQLGLNGERTERRAMPGRKILADTARASFAAGQPTVPSIQSKSARDLARRQFIDSMLGPSIQLTLPLWDQNQAQIAKARFNHLRLSKLYEDMLDLVATEIGLAVNNARFAYEQYHAFQSEILPQVESNLDSARSQYENGEQSVIILIEAQEAMFRSKRSAADALRDYLVAKAELEQVAGGQLSESRDDPAVDEVAADDIGNRE